MSTPHRPALDFMLTRRSHPAKTLAAPVPNRAEIQTLLTAAVRTPDHGKLEPWRFVVLEKAALIRLAALAALRGAELGLAADRLEKGVSQYADSGLVVVVVASPKPSDKVPQIEQVLSAGAVCLALLNAALAAGWGANWLSGWASHDPAFAAQAFGVSGPEFVAGLIHIGTAGIVPADRPRPDLAALVTWVAE